MSQTVEVQNPSFWVCSCGFQNCREVFTECRNCGKPKTDKDNRPEDNYRVRDQLRGRQS